MALTGCSETWTKVTAAASTWEEDITYCPLAYYYNSLIAAYDSMLVEYDQI